MDFYLFFIFKKHTYKDEKWGSNTKAHHKLH